MITNAKIIKALTSQIYNILRETEFEKVPILESDISEPIIRPSIKFDIEESSFAKINSSYVEKSVIIRLYFFAKNRIRPAIENDKMTEILEYKLLEGIMIEDDLFVSIDEVDCAVSDGVLICTFDMVVVNEEEEPDEEMMGQFSYS